MEDIFLIFYKKYVLLIYMKPSRRDISVAANIAEFTISPDFLSARDRAFEASGDDSFDQTSTAHLVIAHALGKTASTTAERHWNIRYQTALAQMRGADLGYYATFLHELGGETLPQEFSALELEPGTPEIVETNGLIIGLNNLKDDSIDFIGDALEVIDERRSGNPKTIGPENYATTLNFFQRKFKDNPPSRHLKEVVENFVNECMDGFTAVAEVDTPNVVEMTNVYSAIRQLPTGTFDKRHTEAVIQYSLELLPQYDDKALDFLVSSISKLDLSETGDTAANLVDLALRKSTGMQNNLGMVHAVRAVSALPQSKAAERTFKTFLEMRNHLERTQELSGLDVINDSLARIVENVIVDTELSQNAKSLALECTRVAFGRLRKHEHHDVMTQEHRNDLKRLYARILANYNKI